MKNKMLINLHLADVSIQTGFQCILGIGYQFVRPKGIDRVIAGVLLY